MLVEYEMDFSDIFHKLQFFSFQKDWSYLNFYFSPVNDFHPIGKEHSRIIWPCKKPQENHADF